MKIKFQHLRADPTNQFGGGVTFAAFLQEGKVFLGFSLCRKNDQFLKEVGRDIALDRLYNTPIIFTFDETPNSISDIALDVLFMKAVENKGDYGNVR